MNILDLIIIVPLIWAIYKGFGQGIIMQLGGIVGIFIGVWLSYRFGGHLGHWFGIADPMIAKATGFVVIFILFVILISVITHLLKGVVKFAGLGMLDTIGGVLLSVFKMALIISVLIFCIEILDKEHKIVDQYHANDSLLYNPIKKVAPIVFPYVDIAKDKLLELGGEK